MIIVAKDERGDFNSINEALVFCKKCGEREIQIKDGIYDERVIIDIDNLSLVGESTKGTVITGNLGAYEILEDGYKRGTFRTYTMLIDANNVTIKDITIENTAGPGSIVGQAIALYAEGFMIKLKNCRLIGHQDTLFTGPLPPKPYEDRGFIGPKENDPRVNGFQVYENCFIKGDIDFIFGSSTAIFVRCEIYSNNLNQDVNGYIAAPSTPENQKYGYVFHECTFTSNALSNTVYLARPWRDYAKAVFIKCSYGKHIKAEGFHDWDKKHAHNTLYFAEYECTSEGDCNRNQLITSMVEKDYINSYTIDSLLEGVENE